MRIAQQLIVAAAVVFATLAVAVNVYASTRGADQREQRLSAEIPVASVLDQGIFDVPPINRPSGDSGEQDDPCADPDECPDIRSHDDDDGTKTHPENHGQFVSDFAKHIGWDHEAGPPGFLVRDVARSDDGKDDKPQPPGLEDKDDMQPPGLDKAQKDKDKDKGKDG